MIEIVRRLLPALNGAVGVASVLALLAWVGDNATREVCFSYDQLALLSGLAFLILELNRRAPTN